jgi:hypothetical protein
LSLLSLISSSFMIINFDWSLGVFPSSHMDLTGRLLSNRKRCSMLLVAED